MSIKLSVIVPTYNRLEQLKRVLSGLENQTAPFEQFEVVVISDGSKDGTEEYVCNRQTSLELYLSSQANQGVAAARNSGLAQARGEIVLFLDDDIVPTPTLLEEHIGWHDKHGDQVVVIGPMLTPPDYNMSPWVRWEQDKLTEQYQAMLNGEWEATARQFYTGNISLRRCHLIQVGGFDPTFRRAEDVELAYRLMALGLRFLFNPQAIGYHYAKRSYKSWIATPYAYGRNDVIFTRVKGQVWLLPMIFQEYHLRHPFTRALAHLLIDHKLFQRWVLSFFRILITSAQYLNLPAISSLGCSAVFNLCYYQGIADELGGRNAFFAGLKLESTRDD